MVIRVQEYVGTDEIIFVEDGVPDGGSSSNGPFLPLSDISVIGFELIEAETAAAARQAIGAAASGINQDIIELRGLTVPLSIAQGGTGSNTAAGAAAGLGVLLSGSVSTKTGAYTATVNDGLILADASSGPFPITIPRALGASGLTKMVMIMKVDATMNPVTIQDDQGTPVVAMVLLTPKQSFALAVATGSTVYAAGVQ